MGAELLTQGNQKLVFIAMARRFFPAGICGLLLAAIIAASISTADSQLLVASSSFTADLYMPFIRKNASDKETAAKELAVDFTDKVYDAYVSPKKGKIDSAVLTDLNFFMIYYVFPAILLTEHDDAKLIADHLCSRWGEKFKNSKIQYTDYDSLYVSFREKIFGIF